MVCSLVLSALVPPAPAAEPAPIRVGLDADLSGGAALGGEAIRRGILLALDEVNAAGGLLGRPVVLEVRDHRGNPARGLDNIEAFAATDDLIAVFGGVHTPVVLHELDAIHRHRLPFLVPWAAGTPIVDNGRDPNYVFRVSVRDEYAGGFLVARALEAGYRRPALLLERTGWGRSNETAIVNALAEHGLSPAAVRWFNWSVRDLNAALSDFLRVRADVVILVSNQREGAVAVRDMARLPPERRLPILSHWGITSGNFPHQAGAALAEVDLAFLQTYSFIDPPHPARARRVLAAYHQRFPDVVSAQQIFAPVGTAHAYDLVHLLAKAVRAAGSTDADAIRTALLALRDHAGLVRDYAHPFRPGHQDALDLEDFRLARYASDGSIVPVGARGR